MRSGGTGWGGVVGAVGGGEWEGEEGGEREVIKGGTVLHRQDT